MEKRFNVISYFKTRLSKISTKWRLIDEKMNWFFMLPSNFYTPHQWHILLLSYSEPVLPVYNNNSNESDPFTFFVSNVQFKKKKLEVLKKVPDWQITKRNVVYFGVRELVPDEYNKYTAKNKPPVPYKLVGNISTNYNVRMFFKCKSPFLFFSRSSLSVILLFLLSLSFRGRRSQRQMGIKGLSGIEPDNNQHHCLQVHSFDLFRRRFCGGPEYNWLRLRLRQLRLLQEPNPLCNGNRYLHHLCSHDGLGAFHGQKGRRKGALLFCY